MRITELHLKAFGHFTDVRLDLDGGGPRLHVLYGPNEAGKSTALRALTALLYGIPTRTTDAFLHPYGSLRIGATIVTRSGESLTFVRRKADKASLLSEDGSTTIDDAVLARVLGGVSKEQFETTFGLDHESLRRGAHALLEGGGDVGESLFDAALGGRGIHQVLARLTEEADAIFTERAHKKALNVALKELAEAQKRVKTFSVSTEAWREQQKALDEAREELTREEDRRRALVKERHRVGRDLAVVPLLAKRARLLEEIAEIGDVPEVSDADVAARQEATRVLERDGAELERVKSEMARHANDRDALAVDDALAAVPEEIVEALRDDLAVHQKEQRDIPRRAAERDLARDQARSSLVKLGREPDALADADALRVAAKDKAALRQLAEAHGALESSARHARERLADARARRARIDASVDASAPADVSALVRAVEAAQRLGDVEARLEEAEARGRAAERELAQAARALFGFEGEARAAAALAVPPADTVDRRIAEHEAAARACADADAEVAALEADVARLEREMKTEAITGDVPTEAQLLDERRARNAQWTELRKMLVPDSGANGERRAPERAVPDADAYEGLVERADGTADRLRREADRVAQHARRVVEREALDGDLRDARARARDARAHLDALDERFRALSAELGVALETPTELRAFREQHARVVAAAARLDAIEDEIAAMRARAEAARDKMLAAALADGVSGVDAASFADVLAAARVRVDEARATEAALARQKAELGEVDADIARLADRLAEHEAELAAWRAAWAAGVARLGLPTDTAPSEASAVLDELDALAKALDKARDEQHRIDAMEENARRFEAEVDRLVAAHARDLEGRPLVERGSGLVARCREAREKASRRDALEAEIARQRARADELAASTERASRVVAERLGALDVATIEEAIAVEQRSMARRARVAELAERESEIREAGETTDLERLASETAGADLGDLRQRKSDLDDEIEEATEAMRAADRNVTSLELGLERRTQTTDAIEAADEAASIAARIRAHAQRYVRLKLAASILEAEIIRYREEHQGPVLARANELFPRLTLGRYARLKTGFGAKDEPVLLAVRAEDDREVAVDGLSDGTRDTLYLALRLASLEHHAARMEPLPLVLDDALVHLDDDRARAALEVLGEVSTKMQILFFTHHARLVELARAAVPPAQLVAHDLARAKESAAAE